MTSSTRPDTVRQIKLLLWLCVYTTFLPNLYPVNQQHSFCKHIRDFFNLFWEGALGPFALGNFLHFNWNWENFFVHFYIIFLNRDPKTALNHSYSWLYALSWLKVHWKWRQFVNYIDFHKNDLLIGIFFVQIGKKCRHLPLGQGPYNGPWDTRKKSLHIFSVRVENSVDPDQMAPPEASWSGSTVFSKKNKSRISTTRVTDNRNYWFPVTPMVPFRY